MEKEKNQLNNDDLNFIKIIYVKFGKPYPQYIQSNLNKRQKILTEKNQLKTKNLNSIKIIYNQYIQDVYNKYLND